MILCLDCDAEIVDATEDSVNQFCGECLGLKHIGDAVFSLDPEAAGADDYIGYLNISRVEKKMPFVVQIEAAWRDDEGMGDDSPPCEPLYLTKTAAQKLITLLKKALAGEVQKPRKALSKTA